MATTSVKAGMKIRSEFSGVKDVVIVQHGLGGNFNVADKSFPLKGFWTEPNFFKIFSFDLVKGNPETALQESNSIVLTEIAAQKLFGDTVLGKTIISKNNTAFVVTGVMRNFPKSSHLQVEVLGSLSTVESRDKENNISTRLGRYLVDLCLCPSGRWNISGKLPGTT